MIDQKVVPDIDLFEEVLLQKEVPIASTVYIVGKTFSNSLVLGFYGGLELVNLGKKDAKRVEGVEEMRENGIERSEGRIPNITNS